MLKTTYKTAKTAYAKEIDKIIGKRIKQYRLLMSMSQEHLARELGITFQQVQKYEKGYNKVSASRLQDIAVVLKRRVEEFFFDEDNNNIRIADDQTGHFAQMKQRSSDALGSSDCILSSPNPQPFGSECNNPEESSSSSADYADSRELLSLVKVYSKIKNHRVRNSISSLAKAMLSQQEEPLQQ